MPSSSCDNLRRGGPAAAERSPPRNREDGMMASGSCTRPRIARHALSLAAAALVLGCTSGHVAYQRSASDQSPSRSAVPNELTSAERSAGWVLLFDGQTFKGWRGLGYPGIPTSHWVVVDGAIKKIASGKVPVQADGQPLEGGDLMTEGTYGDFELQWEWKVTPGANSGVKYNVSEELSTSIPPKHAAKGFEYQMIDDD